MHRDIASLGESWIKHELEAEQGFFVDSDALTCPEQEISLMPLWHPWAIFFMSEKQNGCLRKVRKILNTP